jgi:hypothetical protein
MKFTEEHKEKIRQALIRMDRHGDRNPKWRGGRVINTDGYIWIYQPSHPNHNSENRVLEHRLVMEKHLKRYLNPNEVVHHINGIRDDNRIENLELLNNLSEHQSLHWQERRLQNEA